MAAIPRRSTQHVIASSAVAPGCHPVQALKRCWKFGIRRRRPSAAPRLNSVARTSAPPLPSRWHTGPRSTPTVLARADEVIE
jgi:hypothetical protein